MLLVCVDLTRHQTSLENETSNGCHADKFDSTFARLDGAVEAVSVDEEEAAAGEVDAVVAQVDQRCEVERLVRLLNG